MLSKWPPPSFAVMGNKVSDHNLHTGMDITFSDPHNQVDSRRAVFVTLPMSPDLCFRSFPFGSSVFETWMRWRSRNLACRKLADLRHQIEGWIMVTKLKALFPTNRLRVKPAGQVLVVNQELLGSFIPTQQTRLAI